ncbi:MAG: hypothetical protein K0B09_10560 [Bacteroidales bacterium]|nr:hypothetical protein [Bacteroidales bacterium]
MQSSEFTQSMNGKKRPVILVEGVRSLPEADRAIVVACGVWLARTFPHAVFRTGNADGTDTAFAEGIVQVDPTRLQYVLPYAGHKKKNIAQGASFCAMTEMSEAVAEQAVQTAISASPGCAAMMNNRKRIPSLSAKARYLMRDTVKVIGSLDHGLAPADAGLFFVNAADPMKGGTGHTMRVCREMKVPVFDQVIWRAWLG